ncbi:MAG: hypothetical protein AAF418_00760 [Pseudomonadota bacterium]
MYSHDTFGLGHLRRSMAIADYLAANNKNLTVLILTGSSIIGRFDFKTRVDFVRIPGVIKLRNGDYTPLQLHMNIKDTLRLREQIIRNTADSFNPDLFIVDKEPLGLRGEVRSTLAMLNERGTPCVLGLRDIMDDPDLLEPEWKRKRAIPGLRDFYQELWVYGLAQVCDPLEGLNVPAPVRKKLVYTGYLPRQHAQEPYDPIRLDQISPPYLLVTPGGGGDGETMVDWVLRAYEKEPNLLYPALIVLGPFMNRKSQTGFMARAAALSRVEMVGFHSHMEALYQNAIGVVAMGGYNTFCEILSFNTRALIMPRTHPRLEQFIRATRADELGLATMINPDGKPDTDAMIKALSHLPDQPLPSDAVVPGLLDGLFNVNRLMKRILR